MAIRLPHHGQHHRSSRLLGAPAPNSEKLLLPSETIDPNHYGELRYDIMAEIVKLESIRITEFLETFQHFHDLMHDGDITDELRCDDQMLAFFTPIQTNVILAIPPQWIEETRRPPLTWYASLSQSKAIKVEGRILAPDYYESSGSNSS